MLGVGVVLRKSRLHCGQFKSEDRWATDRVHVKSWLITRSISIIIIVVVLAIVSGMWSRDRSHVVFSRAGRVGAGGGFSKEDSMTNFDSDRSNDFGNREIRRGTTTRLSSVIKHSISSSEEEMRGQYVRMANVGASAGSSSFPAPKWEII